MMIHLFHLVAFLAIIGCQNPLDYPWPKHTIDASSSGADGVRLADVNGDGLMDITTGWEESGFTKVYIHPGIDEVRAYWPSVIAGQAPSVEDAVFADLDGNGVLDVISSTEGKNQKIYFHWAPKNPDDYLDTDRWATELLPASERLMQWMFAVPIQLDGKNGIDFIAGAKGENAGVGWFKSPENPSKISDWSWHPIAEATWIMSIFLSDMDGDGDQDVVVSDRKPGKTRGVRWLENPGVGRLEVGYWENHFVGARGKEVMFMDLVDLDQDGLEDVLVCERTTQKIIIWRCLNKSGNDWDEININIPEYLGLAKAVRAGDLNGDNLLDIVLSTNTMEEEKKEGMAWLSFKNKDDFENYTWHPLSGNEGYKFDRIELLDLDGDGDLDVLTCEENFGASSEGLGVIWYENLKK